MIIGLTEEIADWIDAKQKNVIRIEATAERLTNKYRFLLVGGACLLYLVPTIELTRRKLIWTDEFFTLFLGRLNASELWTALLTGCDQHPPPFYLMHHLFLRAFGENPFALRLPAILGFLLMMLCLYYFVAKRTSVAYGMVAMLIPLATVAYEFAYEARGYSPLLGFVALAVLCWQQVDDPRWRSAAIIGLAAALTAGVLSHYYTIFLLPAIALGEVARSIRRRTWQLGVWVAICVPVIPLLAFLPVIKTASGYTATFWAKASVAEIHSFYENIAGSAVTCLLVCFVVAGIYGVISQRRANSTPAERKIFPIEEIVLGIALASAPITAYVFGKAITGVFAWRYAIGGVVGLALLFGLLCFRLFRGSAIAAWLIILVVSVSFLVSARTKARKLGEGRSSLRNLISWFDKVGKPSEPLVIGDSQTFYTLSYYSPPAMKDRYIYLVDTQRSLKYLGHDTPDRSLLALHQWFGLNVKDYRPYVESHSNMKVWIPSNPKWIWLLSALIDDGSKLTVLGRLGTSILFSASAVELGTAH
jgi:dolichyl-phosphate-mannose-protein mannosyltransferase